MTNPAKLLEKWWDETCIVAQMLRDRDTEIDRLRKAIEPFARAADSLDIMGTSSSR